jgi:hypothetical protein
MEYAVRPPDQEATQSDREPWVLESCRNCIESAALMAHLSAGNPGDIALPISWLEAEMLFAAHLVILQAKSFEGLAPVFDTVGDAEILLDLIEATFETGARRSSKIRRGLEILRNVRQNLPNITSPGVSSTAAEGEHMQGTSG